jgi:hypothetical protein
MPFRLGEIVLFGFFALLLYVIFHRCPRDKGDSQKSKILKDDVPVASVVEVAPASETEAQSATRDKESECTSEPTGRVGKVGGRGALFECLEYRCGELYETHVYQIDAKGKRISEAYVYREPFDQVKESFTTVAA